MIGISVGVPVLVWLCQAFLSLWYFKCHFLYFLSVSVNLIQCSWLPIRVHSGLLPFCCKICLGTSTLNKTQNGSTWKEPLILLGCFTEISAFWSSSWLGCSKVLTGRTERDLRWRSCSHYVKQCSCQAGNSCYCSALYCLFYTLCIWWTKDISCCPLPREFSLARFWLKRKESWFMLLRIRFHLLPWGTLGTLSQSPSMKDEVIFRKFKLSAFAFSSEIELQVMKQQRSCRIILINLLWFSFWILWQVTSC